MIFRQIIWFFHKWTRLRWNREEVSQSRNSLLLDVVYFLCFGLVYWPLPTRFKEKWKDGELTFSERAWVRSSHSVHHLLVIRIFIMISTFFLFFKTTSFFLASSCLSNLICAMILFKQGVDHVIQTTRKMQMLKLDKRTSIKVKVLGQRIRIKKYLVLLFLVIVWITEFFTIFEA